jgi:hypothetical protein
MRLTASQFMLRIPISNATVTLQAPLSKIL